MNEKAELRKTCLKRRKAFVESLSEETLERISIQFVDRMQSYFVFPSICTVGTYFSKPDELSTLLLNFSLQAEGHIVAYPSIENDGSLMFRQVKNLSELEEGSYGVKQAPKSAPAVDPDLFIVPLVAFDERCHRLGYGKGHFDRTLEKARAARKVLAIGVAYDMQKVDKLFNESFDQQLDYVVTDSQIYKAM